MGMRRESIYVKGEKKSKSDGYGGGYGDGVSHQSREKKRASVCMNPTYPVYYNWERACTRLVRFT